MRVVSWNVQGLGGPHFQRYRGRLRQELQRCLVGGPIDVLMLQEHHLSVSRTRRCGRVLGGQSSTFWVPAFGPGGVQGGVCIAISEQWTADILDSGTIVPGRAQWVMLRVGEDRVGFLNVYAPNSASGRTVFWDTIVDALPQADHWCVGGDFNMLEDAHDRQGGSLCTIQGAESVAWERLCLHLRVTDAWITDAFERMPASLDFSRSDRRVGVANLSRIDRFYVDEWAIGRGGEVGILAGTTLSDHAPVILWIEEHTRRTTSPQMRIPDSLLECPEIDCMIQEIWDGLQWTPGHAASVMAEGLISISTMLRRTARERQAQRDEDARRLRRGLASLQSLQETSPESLDIEHQIGQARAELREIEERRHDYIYHRSASHWTQVGDRVTADFFEITGPRHTRSGIRRLRRADGSLTSETPQLRAIATEFYTSLLTAEPHTDRVERCRQDVWTHCRRVVTEEMGRALLAPFSYEELERALVALPRGKCPGEDGLSVAFFMRFWPSLEQGICMAFQEIMDTGQMPESLTEGLIHLIPKEGGDRDEIRHWRPITLLGTAYKILAKTISLRLQPFLDTTIHATQTGFVRGRSILDNIFTFWEATAWARLQGEGMAVLLLDFEKAYGRVDWAFLEGTLERLGFPLRWIRGVSSLYSSAHSRVMVGGGMGERFPLSRSVRQGCPLAPTLFLFFAEAMSSFLAAQHTGLQGLRLPIREEELLDSEFADDTAVYLRGSLMNLQSFQLAIETFCTASGSKINWHKSCGFWTGQGESPQWCGLRETL
eukprot:c25362_g1_i1 orf=3-2321(-)